MVCIGQDVSDFPMRRFGTVSGQWSVPVSSAEARPRTQVVWLQSGISEPRFEEALARAGIRVVPDRCLKVDRTRALSRL